MEGLIKRGDIAGVRDWWSAAPQLDENSLRDGILALLREIHQVAVYDDWDAMQEYIKLYQLGESYCIEEPLLSQYEFGKLGIGTMTADHYLARGDYPKTVEKIEEVIAAYNARMERYQRLGMPLRRASRIKTHYLLILATLKWTASEEWRDTVMTPDQILEEFETTAEHILEFIKNNRSEVGDPRNEMESLALTELACCKMALRYTPKLVAEQVRRFNSRHGQHLAVPAGHYKNVDGANSNKSAYYWDFELAKLRFAESVDLQDIYMCVEIRAMTAPDTFGDWPIQGLFRNWRREALMIIRERQLRDAQ